MLAAGHLWVHILLIAFITARIIASLDCISTVQYMIHFISNFVRCFHLAAPIISAYLRLRLFTKLAEHVNISSTIKIAGSKRGSGPLHMSPVYEISPYL